MRKYYYDELDNFVYNPEIIGEGLRLEEKMFCISFPLVEMWVKEKKLYDTKEEASKKIKLIIPKRK